MLKPLLTTLLTLMLAVNTQAAQLTISAAASLTNAFKELAQAFEQAHPEHQVQLNFAGSGALLAQIRKGAPVDVFASADQTTMNQAQSDDLIVNTSRFDFVQNRLVVITPKTSQLNPTELEDLTQTAFARIALSNPQTVPVGRYSKKVLEEAKLWPALESKLISTQHVRQSLDYVARGEVDAGFVYATDAATMVNKVNVAFAVPTSEPILYPIAIVKGSEQQSAAKAWLEFLRQPSSQQVLAKYGFSAAQ